MDFKKNDLAFASKTNVLRKMINCKSRLFDLQVFQLLARQLMFLFSETHLLKKATKSKLDISLFLSASKYIIWTKTKTVN